jgi:AhpD family alkylhydroperoxidase
MQARFNYTHAAPGAYKAMLGLEQYLHNRSLEAPLLHLIKLPASQINGCAYCLDMHWKDLRAIGKDEPGLYFPGRLARMSLLHGPRARGASVG